MSQRYPERSKHDGPIINWEISTPYTTKDCPECPVGLHVGSVVEDLFLSIVIKFVLIACFILIKHFLCLLCKLLLSNINIDWLKKKFMLLFIHYNRDVQFNVL